MSTTGSWRVSLRIARRTLRRSWGRTLLIAILVATPIAAATFGDILARSLDSDDRYAARTIGDADAMVVVTGAERLEGFTPSPELYDGMYSEAEAPRRDPASVDLAALLPAGSRLEAREKNGDLRIADLPDQNLVTLNVVDLPREVTGFLKLTGGDRPAGDDVAVSPALAEELALLDDGDLRTGATLRLTDTDETVRVTGLVENEWCLKCHNVYAAPGSAAQAAATLWNEPDSTYYVDLPAGTDAFALSRDLADRGVAMSPRTVFENPDDYRDWDNGPLTADDWRAIGLTAVIVGFGILEIVLLAGAAFSVGARRQVRDLGLAAAAGASPRHIRTVVLAQGLVIGLLGSALGLVVGAAVAIGGRALWEHLDGAIIPSWHAGPELVFAVVFGAVAGLLAALVPAIGAGRMPVVAALAGRFRVTSARARRTPALGVGLLALGVALVFVGERSLAQSYQDYLDAVALIQEVGGYVDAPSPTLPVAMVLVGAITIMAGLLLVIPSIIEALAGAAGRFPLPVRLAVRDASRHRQRTAPAAAAIVVSVAGAVLAAFMIVGTEAANEATYVPQLPERTIAVGAEPEVRTEADAAVATVAQTLPEGRVTEVRMVGTWVDESDGTPAEEPGGEGTYLQPLTLNPVNLETCELGCEGTYAPLAIGDPAALELSLGRPATPDELAFLADGGVLTTSPVDVTKEGTVRVSREEAGVSGGTVTLPGRLVDRTEPWQSLPGSFVSARTAAEQGWVVDEDSGYGGGTFVSYGDEATAAQVRAAMKQIEAAGAYAYRDTGPSQLGSLPLLVAGGISAFVTLVAVGIAVALSSAEGRADLSTLAAVGASPRLRRRFTAAQTLTLAGLGSVVGLLVGTLLAFALRGTVGAPSFEVPWLSLGATLLGVPLFAVLVAAAVTPSRLPMVRRLD